MQQRVRTRALKADTSLLASRPRRICRLPSRFDDHSISPSKFIPLQPANASTPIQQSKAKSKRNNETYEKETKTSNKKQSPVSKPTRSVKATALQKKINSSTVKSSPDTNNNAKTRSTRAKKALPKPQTSKNNNISYSNSSPQISPIKKVRPIQTLTKKVSPKPTIPKKESPKSTTAKRVGKNKNNDKSLSIIATSPGQNSIKKFFNRTASPQSSPVNKISPKTNNNRVIDKSLSFKVLGGNKRTRDNEQNDDIYEFTFDPNEEPQPQKKKRKKTSTKKTVKVTKPKSTVTYKTTYDQNINKALLALKNIVKPSKTVEVAALPKIQEISDEAQERAGKNPENHVMNDTGKTSVNEGNYPSIRVEDIAADIEPSIDHGDDLNYSPVNSPRPASPKRSSLNPRRTSVKHVNDPLNLQEDLSFFDDIPVASSSMNVSVRHPLASPWRVEFGNLPIRWHSNTYVKPNMTPAVESSFICSEESNKKKHVYTNMLPETNDSLPQIVSNTSLKQPSIIEFIKEVAERQAKKKRGRSKSPTKAAAAMHNFDINNITPPEPENIPTANISEVPPNSTNDKENSKEEIPTKKQKQIENISDKPGKSLSKENDKACTFFGFDDSESINQENISPVKVTNKGRTLRSKRPVLQEINGPTRAVFPVNAKTKIAVVEAANFEDNENQDQENTSPPKVKSKGRTLRSRTKVLQERNSPAKAALPVAVNSKPVASSEAIDKVFEDVNPAADAPVFPEEEMDENVTNIDDPTYNDDSQSVHLFEDIDVVHHLKLTRKSYGKAKKVTFCQKTRVDSDASEDGVPEINDASFDDDFGDFTFEIPNIQEKKKPKKKPKKLMSKKEEKEAEEWAAGFNSMCEEIEDFPLVVE